MAMNTDVLTLAMKYVTTPHDHRREAGLSQIVEKLAECLPSALLTFSVFFQCHTAKIRLFVQTRNY